jgi:hypothetical protein
LTLLEALIAATVLAMSIATPAMLLSNMAAASSTEWAAARQEVASNRALEMMEERLREVDPITLAPTLSEPLSSDFIDFQRVVAYAGGPVLGPLERIGLEPTPEDPVNGLDDDGDGIVDEHRLVRWENPGGIGGERQVLCNGVRAAAVGEVLGNGLDDNGNGLIDEAGLAIEVEDGLLRVLLTVAGTDGDGHQMTRTHARTIAFRRDV